MVTQFLNKYKSQVWTVLKGQEFFSKYTTHNMQYTTDNAQHIRHDTQYATHTAYLAIWCNMMHE